MLERKYKGEIEHQVVELMKRADDCRALSGLICVRDLCNTRIALKNPQPAIDAECREIGSSELS